MSEGINSPIDLFHSYKSEVSDEEEARIALGEIKSNLDKICEESLNGLANIEYFVLISRGGIFDDVCDIQGKIDLFDRENCPNQIAHFKERYNRGFREALALFREDGLSFGIDVSVLGYRNKVEE